MLSKLENWKILIYKKERIFYLHLLFFSSCIINTSYNLKKFIRSRATKRLLENSYLHI